MSKRMSKAPHKSVPEPHDTLSDEGGQTISWLASAWSKQDIIEDEFWRELTPESLHEQWLGCRWTMDAERANPAELYDMFGDYELSGADTSVVYYPAEADSFGAHRYWTTEP
jgi:hypothetical protein